MLILPLGRNDILTQRIFQSLKWDFRHMTRLEL